MRGRTHYEKHTTKGRITVSKYSGDSTNLGYLGGSWGKGTQWAGCWMWCPSRQSGDPEQTWWADLHKKKSHHRLSGERRATVWVCLYLSFKYTSFERHTPYPVHPDSSRGSLAAARGPWCLCAQRSDELQASYKSEKREKRGESSRGEIWKCSCFKAPCSGFEHFRLCWLPVEFKKE